MKTLTLASFAAFASLSLATAAQAQTVNSNVNNNSNEGGTGTSYSTTITEGSSTTNNNVNFNSNNAGGQGGASGGTRRTRVHGLYTLAVTGIKNQSSSDTTSQAYGENGLSLMECHKRAADAWGELTGTGFTDIKASCTGQGKSYTAAPDGAVTPGKPQKLVWTLK